MAYLTGSLIGSLIWPIVAAAIAWFMSSKKERKTRILITIVSFTAVLITFNGVKYIVANAYKLEPQNNTSLESSQQETEETTESEKTYAKLGPLAIDITNLWYERIKSVDELDLPDYTDKEKQDIWETINQFPNSKVKIWQQPYDYYILTITKLDNSGNRFDSLDEFVNSLTHEYDDTKTSGTHIDIDGVHAYKLLERKTGYDWGASETIFLHDGYFYIVTLNSMYTGDDIDVESETEDIISHMKFKK